MDWANERYVRIYTRDTADDLVLSWQARGLWPLLVRKADRSGVIATNHGPRGVAALVQWPPDVVEPALCELLVDGRVAECHEPIGYVIQNYIQAQETPSSDKQRKKNERETRRDLANKSVTKRDARVTKRDEKSRAVTPSHSESHGVTPCLTVPSQTVLTVVPPPASPPQNGTAAIERFTLRFEQAYSKKAGWTTGHAVSFHRLAKEHGVEELIARIDRLFDGRGPSWLTGPFDPGTLVSQWNQLVVDAAAAKSTQAQTKFAVIPTRKVEE